MKITMFAFKFSIERTGKIFQQTVNLVCLMRLSVSTLLFHAILYLQFITTVFLLIT